MYKQFSQSSINVASAGFIFTTAVLGFSYWCFATWSYEFPGDNGETVIYTISWSTQICFSMGVGMLASWLILAIVLLLTGRLMAFIRCMTDAAMAPFKAF